MTTGEPAPRPSEGGRPVHRYGVSWKQAGAGAIVVAGAVWGAFSYLDGKFSEVTEAVNRNTERLAIVETEVKGLRRDMGRVEGDIRRIEKNTKPVTTGLLELSPR